MVPRSCSEIMMERRASTAEPPAWRCRVKLVDWLNVEGKERKWDITLRITCASPREMPNAAAGSMRASMHVTLVTPSSASSGTESSQGLEIRGWISYRPDTSSPAAEPDRHV